MTTPLNLINREYDKLTVKRDMGDGTFHCECKCGGYRRVSRRSLIHKSVKSCARCAAANRGGKPEQPVPVPAEPMARIDLLPCKGCVIRIIDGIRYDSYDASCPRHWNSGSGPAYPRSTLSASSSIARGRHIYD